MIQTRFPIALLVLTLGSGTTAWCDDPPKAEAAPDPCVTDLTHETLDNPPQRKTNFVRAEEPLKIPLNVKLIDQKSAATIGIELPKDEIAPGRSRGSEFVILRLLNRFRGAEDYEHFRALQLIRGSYLLAPNLGLRDERIQNERLADAMERMLAQIPTDRAPDKAAREFFTSAEIDKYVSTLADGPNRRTFVVLGATAEEAQQRAQTLLTILDQGFSRPIQLALFKQREAQCQQAAEQKQKIAAAELQLKTIGEELQKYADFTPDTLAGVRVQQFQADAELAGLKAKVEAYEKLLKDKERNSPLFDAKTTAEVDLISCEVRRATIAAIIAKIKLRGELMEKQTAAATAKDKAVAGIESISKHIRSIDDDITAFGPVRLTDDRVTISEVEWVRRPE